MAGYNGTPETQAASAKAHASGAAGDHDQAAKAHSTAATAAMNQAEHHKAQVERHTKGKKNPDWGAATPHLHAQNQHHQQESFHRDQAASHFNAAQKARKHGDKTATWEQAWGPTVKQAGNDGGALLFHQLFSVLRSIQGKLKAAGGEPPAFRKAWAACQELENAWGDNEELSPIQDFHRLAGAKELAGAKMHRDQAANHKPSGVQYDTRYQTSGPHAHNMTSHADKATSAAKDRRSHASASLAHKAAAGAHYKAALHSGGETEEHHKQMGHHHTMMHQHHEKKSGG